MTHNNQNNSNNDSNQRNLNHDSDLNNLNTNNSNRNNSNQNSNSKDTRDGEKVSNNNNFPGTVTVTAGSTTVTGLNTDFTNTFSVGDQIEVKSESQKISSIESNTSLTTAAWIKSVANSVYTK